MQGTEILSFLKRTSGAFEAYLRTEYLLYRELKGGGVQEVRVVVLDGGPGMGPTRFHVTAQTDDGRKATGNAAESVETALSLVHWFDLDR